MQKTVHNRSAKISAPISTTESQTNQQKLEITQQSNQTINTTVVQSSDNITTPLASTVQIPASTTTNPKGIMNNIETWKNEMAAKDDQSDETAKIKQTNLKKQASAVNSNKIIQMSSNNLSPSVDLNLKIESCKKVWDSSSVSQSAVSSSSSSSSTSSSSSSTTVAASTKINENKSTKQTTDLNPLTSNNKNVCTVKPTQQMANNLSPPNTQLQQVSTNTNVSTIANNNSNVKNYYDKMLINQAASTAAAAATLTATVAAVAAVSAAVTATSIQQINNTSPSQSTTGSVSVGGSPSGVTIAPALKGISCDELSNDVKKSDEKSSTANAKVPTETVAVTVPQITEINKTKELDSLPIVKTPAVASINQQSVQLLPPHSTIHQLSHPNQTSTLPTSAVLIEPQQQQHQAINMQHPVASAPQQQPPLIHSNASAYNTNHSQTSYYPLSSSVNTIVGAGSGIVGNISSPSSSSSSLCTVQQSNNVFGYGQQQQVFQSFYQQQQPPQIIQQQFQSNRQIMQQQQPQKANLLDLGLISNDLFMNNPQLDNSFGNNSLYQQINQNYNQMLPIQQQQQQPYQNANTNRTQFDQNMIIQQNQQQQFFNNNNSNNKHLISQQQQNKLSSFAIAPGSSLLPAKSSVNSLTGIQFGNQNSNSSQNNSPLNINPNQPYSQQQQQQQKEFQYFNFGNPLFNNASVNNNGQANINQNTNNNNFFHNNFMSQIQASLSQQQQPPPPPPPPVTAGANNLFNGNNTALFTQSNNSTHNNQQFGSLNTNLLQQQQQQRQTSITPSSTISGVSSNSSSSITSSLMNPNLSVNNNNASIGANNSNLVHMQHQQQIKPNYENNYSFFGNGFESTNSFNNNANINNRPNLINNNNKAFESNSAFNNNYSFENNKLNMLPSVTPPASSQNAFFNNNNSNNSVTAVPIQNRVNNNNNTIPIESQYHHHHQSTQQPQHRTNQNNTFISSNQQHQPPLLPTPPQMPLQKISHSFDNQFRNINNSNQNRSNQPNQYPRRQQLQQPQFNTKKNNFYENSSLKQNNNKHTAVNKSAESTSNDITNKTPVLTTQSSSNNPTKPSPSTSPSNNNTNTKVITSSPSPQLATQPTQNSAESN